MPYKCPICKKKYVKYSWFVKHIQSYSAEVQQRIFFNEKNGSISLQAALNKFIED